MRLWIIAAVLCAGVACENDVDNSENVLPKPKDAGQVPEEDTNEPTDVAVDACDECVAADTWWRTTEIRLLSVDGNDQHLAVTSLNSEWSADIARGELSIFFRVRERNGDAVVIDIRSGANTGNGGDVCYLESGGAELTASFGSCELTSTADTALSIYGGSLANPTICGPTLQVPNAIPLADVQVDGAFSPDCSVFSFNANGVILRSALANSCSCLYRSADEPASACGNIVPGDFNASDCGGCGVGKPAGSKGSFANLESALTLLSAGKPFATCIASNDEQAVCITATVKAERIDAPPSPCD